MLQYIGSVVKVIVQKVKVSGNKRSKCKKKLVIQLLFYKQYDKIISKNKVHVY